MSVDALPPPSPIDVIAVAVVALGGLHGFVRGLSGELTQFAGVVGAFVFGLWLHNPATSWILAHSRLSGRPAQVLAFAVTAAAAFAVLILLRSLLRPVMRVVVEDRFEKTGGLIAGLTRNVLLVLIVFVVMILWPHPYLNKKFGEESLIGSLIRPHLTVLEDGDRDKAKDKDG